MTKRENFMATLRGEKAERFVNQYEAFELIDFDPIQMGDRWPAPGETMVKSLWGVTLSWPEGTPGPFPVHDDEHIVVKDITEWRKYMNPPKTDYPAEAWKQVVKHAESIDRKDKFVAMFVAPGVFEMTHYLLEIQNCLMNFYEEPEAMHELIDYITEAELRYAEQVCKYIKPDALFHHDDWGSQASTFISPAMFEEFILPAYKKIYGYYKSHGVEVIVHHSDSYAETLVPYMIEMGIDVWQGAMTTNDISGILEKYGDKLTIMGGIDSASVDFPGWTPEVVEAEVEKACRKYGTKHYIPCASIGAPGSVFPGVYEKLTESIEKMSKEMF